jgi:2'-5' RNA ligase
MVIVAVPDVADPVDRWREQTCNDKPSIGVPAHITLLFPFAPATQLDRPMIASLAEVVGEVDAFEFALGKTSRFPTTLYLAPEPASPFIELNSRTLCRT